MEGIQFNNREVIILGAGGLAREIVSWNNISQKNNYLNIIGFLDDNLNALDRYDINLEIIGGLNLSNIKQNQFIMCAISDGNTKNIILTIALQLNIPIIDFVHESCFIGERTTLGKGLVMLPFALISCDAKIGDLVLVNGGTQIGHDVSIGNYCSIMANVDIGGGAVLGDNVFVGSGAVILPNVKIPSNCRIGAGSVVIRSIKQSGTYFGNPAKKIF